MSAFLLLTAVRAQTTVTGFLQGVAARLADDERGQDVVEYLGVLAVVAVLIGVVSGVAGQLTSPILSGAKHVISEVFNH
jgi:Flp pilus assembly pilin Flp